MRLFVIALPALMLTGCATVNKNEYPCEFAVRLHIDTASKINDLCHLMPNLVSDLGVRIGSDERVNGCASFRDNTIYSRDVDTTLIHELRHFVWLNCDSGRKFRSRRPQQAN